MSQMGSVVAPSRTVLHMGVSKMFKKREKRAPLADPATAGEKSYENRMQKTVQNA